MGQTLSYSFSYVYLFHWRFGLIHFTLNFQDKSRKATGMQVDATEDGYTDHELFSLSSMKVSLQFDLSLFISGFIFGNWFLGFSTSIYVAFWICL